ncbi:phosphate ABC transporter ATP-binding protein [Syntrophothermus lipocalidus]|uniref:ABC transporter related protein n=1 Tax=Syntrophothermus lipocalidus (strain DSM 12680 / TGB-C1) TaxID=643648 RepID=D7CP80_SYNLT|nr:phosphate ABC transporter ATP-binding protein [Syntrophothermus lipocalidus]ADI02515.1 ABC transporter related protein [Syntrophothermus lipocalidus DSM 12680]
MKLFELAGITKRFGSRTVLDISELTLYPDRIYAILGPNGAGKTTLLRVLNLLLPPDSGKIRFMEVDVDHSERTRLALSREMCMVFQRPYMFRTNVFENVAYGLRLRNIAGRELRDKVTEALRFVGMLDFARRPAHKLSSGEAQRVALARALALRPRVLLLDEPTANLDPASVQALENIIKGCREEYRATVIMVTHNLFQAKRLAHEVVLLHEGRIIEHQDTVGFFNSPKDIKTVQFLNGTMVY